MSKKIDLVSALKAQGVEFEEGQEKVIAELSTAVEKAMETQNATFETSLKTAIEERIGVAEKDDDGNTVTIMTKLKDVAEQVEKLSNKTAIKMSEVEKYQLKATIERDHKEIVKAIKNKTPYQIEFKAAAIHMTNNGTVTNDTGLDYPATDNFLVDNDIAKIRYPENFILNVIPNTQVANVPAQRIRKEQAPKEGAVAVTAEGAVKPLQQYKFVRTSTDRAKYAGRIEWSEEFEMDFMALFAERDLVGWVELDLDAVKTALLQA